MRETEISSPRWQTVVSQSTLHVVFTRLLDLFLQYNTSLQWFYVKICLIHLVWIFFAVCFIWPDVLCPGSAEFDPCLEGVRTFNRFYISVLRSAHEFCSCRLRELRSSKGQDLESFGERMAQTGNLSFRRRVWAIKRHTVMTSLLYFGQNFSTILQTT